MKFISSFGTSSPSIHLFLYVHSCNVEIELTLWVYMGWETVLWPNKKKSKSIFFSVGELFGGDSCWLGWSEVSVRVRKKLRDFVLSNSIRDIFFIFNWQSFLLLRTSSHREWMTIGDRQLAPTPSISDLFRSNLFVLKIHTSNYGTSIDLCFWCDVIPIRIYIVIYDQIGSTYSYTSIWGRGILIVNLLLLNICVFVSLKLDYSHLLCLHIQQRSVLFRLPIWWFDVIICDKASCPFSVEFSDYWSLGNIYFFELLNWNWT